MSITKIANKLLHCMDPEMAHDLAITTLKYGLYPKQKIIKNNILESNILGMNFKNPIGLAAGFDKNADCIKNLFQQNFGFIETGTATPKSQKGNHKPRLFRLSQDQAIINRMGFNNKGAEYYCNNLANNFNKFGIVGANIGKNKNSESHIDDYVSMLRYIDGKCNYVTINISSPNTVGLRELQKQNYLNQLLEEISKTRYNLKYKTPIFVKISPDCDFSEYHKIVESCIYYNIDGIIVSNTTIERPDSLISKHKNQTGGLSGSVLFDQSNKIIKKIYQISENKLIIIGVGGISNAKDVLYKMSLGASLVQIYTALIYNGFELINEILLDLINILEKKGVKNITDIIGTSYEG